MSAPDEVRSNVEFGLLDGDRQIDSRTISLQVSPLYAEFLVLLLQHLPVGQKVRRIGWRERCDSRVARLSRGPDFAHGHELRGNTEQFLVGSSGSKLDPVLGSN